MCMVEIHTEFKSQSLIKEFITIELSSIVLWNNVQIKLYPEKFFNYQILKVISQNSSKKIKIILKKAKISNLFEFVET